MYNSIHLFAVAVYLIPRVGVLCIAKRARPYPEGMKMILMSYEMKFVLSITPLAAGGASLVQLANYAHKKPHPTTSQQGTEREGKGETDRDGRRLLCVNDCGRAADLSRWNHKCFLLHS